MKRLVFLSILLASATASEAMMQEPTEPTAQSQQAQVLHRKHHWTQKEDNALVNAVQTHGTSNWEIIAHNVPERTTRQCKERYKLLTSSKEPWTEEEDRLLFKKRNELGPKWTLISSFFGHRCDTNIKNRYNFLLRQTDRHSLDLSIPNNINALMEILHTSNQETQLAVPVTPVAPTPAVPTVPPAQQLIPTIDNTLADNSTSSFNQTDSYLDDFNEFWFDELWSGENDFFLGGNEADDFLL